MVCPRCGSKCAEGAPSCSRCGFRFERRQQSSYDDGRQVRQRSEGAQRQPGRIASQGARPARSSATEKKYLIVGSITFVFLIAVAVLLITSLSCVCSNSCDSCAKSASVSDINDSVGGEEWGGVEGEGAVSPADAAAAAPAAPEVPVQ